MKQRISARELRQQLSTAPLGERPAIRERLFAMAKTDPDACIEAMHLLRMYTNAQREDYYRTKQWCEDVDNYNKPKKCVKSRSKEVKMNQAVKVRNAIILEDNTLQRFTELVPEIERTGYFSWYFEAKKRGNYLVLIRNKVIEIPCDEIEFDYEGRLTHASA
jgi:hypothetical protein